MTVIRLQLIRLQKSYDGFRLQLIDKRESSGNQNVLTQYGSLYALVYCMVNAEGKHFDRIPSWLKECYNIT